MVCDANGVLWRFLLSPGQASDISLAQSHLRLYCDRYRMQPVIPLCTLKRKNKPELPRLFDRPKYRQRNIIERKFGWLK